jgi:protein translocase SecG subunit
MQHVIIAIHLMVVTALVALVLYQKSEGGALGMGSSGFMTGRGQANALTRATGILGTIFFLTSIALTVLPAWERRQEGGEDWTKAIDQGTIQLKEIKKPEGKDVNAAPEKAPEGAKESIFEQLQRAQEQRQKAAQPPVAPPQPAPKAEAPNAEAPPAAVEAPKAEAPKTEAPSAEAPKAEAPAAGDNAVPKSEPVKEPEAAKPAAPAVKAPEAPAAEAPAKAPEAAAPVPAPQEAAPAAPEEKPAASPPPTVWKSPSQ